MIKIFDDYEIDENGNSYISIIEASRQTDFSRSSIQLHLKGNTGEWFYE